MHRKMTASSNGATIDDNYEAFVRDGTIVHSPDVDNLLETDLAPGARTKMPEGE
jgi:hypothetical protein